MGKYYIFETSLVPTIESLFGNKKGDGFFAWTNAQKLVSISNIPQSDTNTEPLKVYKNVVILEVKNWSIGDELLQQGAESQSLFFSNDNIAIINFLNKI